MFTALVVDDDQKLNSLYCSFLEKEGYRVIAALSAAEAMAAFDSHNIDIMVCDIAMPDVDGFMLVHAVRTGNAELPIIMATELDDLKSKQRAFGNGADDYMVKPVDLNELSLRMTALLRRAGAVSSRKVVIGDAVLDRDSFSVVEGSTSTVLPPKEFLILLKLCSSEGRIFTRANIMNDIWGVNTESNERTVDVHVKRLRDRFANSKSFRIETVRGVGYKATALK